MVSRKFLHDISNPVQSAKLLLGALRKNTQKLPAESAAPLLETIERIGESLNELTQMIHSAREKNTS